MQLHENLIGSTHFKSWECIIVKIQNIQQFLDNDHLQLIAPKFSIMYNIKLTKLLLPFNDTSFYIKYTFRIFHCIFPLPISTKEHVACMASLSPLSSSPSPSRPYFHQNKTRRSRKHKSTGELNV